MKIGPVKRTIIFKHRGFQVTMHVTAFRKIDDAFLAGCLADYVLRTPELKSDVEVDYPTNYGEADNLPR